ncbi:MAG TPA: YbhN family protein, partial [Solimonas sp.]|nr:YbhN family protein [Solimonas sp.]
MHGWQRMKAGANDRYERRQWLKWLNRTVTVAFIVLVGWLVVSRAQSVDWAKVTGSLREMPAWVLVLAALFAAASYAIYACFDWFARIYTTQVPKLRQFEIALVSYAFNLNLGALIGSVGFRYRLYSRSGVDAKNIARIVATSMVTNWSGYLLLGGIVFIGRCVTLPEGW